MSREPPRDRLPHDWGTLEAYEGRGLWVPNGMTAVEIVKGARAITDQFDIDKFTARDIAIALLRVIRAEHSDRAPQESRPMPHTGQ